MSLDLHPTVTLETKLFPPAVVDMSSNAPPSAGGVVAGVAVALALKALKPKVTITLAGEKVVQWAPAGEPGKNEWHTTRIVLLVALGFLAFKVVRIIL